MARPSGHQVRIKEDLDSVKLAFVKKNYAPFGGAENYLKTVIEQLLSSGHEVHVFANRWVKQPGLYFHKIPSIDISSFISNLSFAVNEKRILKRLSFDAIVSFERTVFQDIYRAGEGCHAEWLRLRAKIDPVWKRVSFSINPLHITLLNLEKRLFSNTRIIIANSDMGKSHIIKHYNVPEERIRVIYNGVDLKRFSPENKKRWRTAVRSEYSVTDNTGLVLFVGSGFERKGLKTLLAAISSLNLNKAFLRLFVIGKGNTEKFKSIAEGYRVHDVVSFLGSQTEIERFYAAADLFVLPTVYDPFSNATIEAMASGIPVITTKNNGASELIEDGQEGFVLDDLLDAGELSDKIMLALDDAEIMGARARTKAEGFPIERAGCEFVDLISECLPS